MTDYFQLFPGRPKWPRIHADSYKGARGRLMKHLKEIRKGNADVVRRASKKEVDESLSPYLQNGALKFNHPKFLLNGKGVTEGEPKSMHYMVDTAALKNSFVSIRVLLHALFSLIRLFRVNNRGALMIPDSYIATARSEVEINRIASPLRLLDKINKAVLEFQAELLAAESFVRLGALERGVYKVITATDVSPKLKYQKIEALIGQFRNEPNFKFDKKQAQSLKAHFVDLQSNAEHGQLKPSTRSKTIISELLWLNSNTIDEATRTDAWRVGALTVNSDSFLEGHPEFLESNGDYLSSGVPASYRKFIHELCGLSRKRVESVEYRDNLGNDLFRNLPEHLKDEMRPDILGLIDDLVREETPKRSHVAVGEMGRIRRKRT